jgi:hypothetical protein
LLPFGAEYFVFQFAIQKYKDEDILKQNCPCCFVWAWNPIPHIEGGMLAEGVGE